MCEAIPTPHPPPLCATPVPCVPCQYLVCRASTGFCWTVTAYTVPSRAGMAQGFAGPARLIPLSESSARCYRKVKGEGGDDQMEKALLPSLNDRKLTMGCQVPAKLLFIKQNI